MTHYNVTDIVERAKAQWDDITADPDTAIRREKWSVWANTTGLALIDEAETLRKQLENAREVIIEANNSLYGSQGYFLSLDGGPPNKYHLAEGIENLKSNARLAAREALKGQP